ncbi:restriction endonuclease subunit S, partial [Hydrogenimonas sp.]
EMLSELQTQSDLIAKLRSSILSDAVSGRLVPQDPTDEPAGVLLERIKAEKEQLVKAGKIKRPKPLPPISDDEIPYELPDGWGWCRIQEITVSMSTGPFGSMLHKSDYVSNGIPVINPTSIIKNHIVPHSGMMISEKTSQKLSRYKMQKNDIIIARRGDLSKCAIVTETEDGWLCGTGSFILRLSKYINRKYFILFFTSSFCQSVLNGTSVGTTMSNLNQGVLNSILFPLPSTTLQCQIVEKVEKLMATCDQLEAEVQKSRTEIDRLMQTVLKEAFA